MSQFIAGKCLLLAKVTSSAYNALIYLNVFCVTGSEKSAPGGLTAPTIVNEPQRSGLPRHLTLPALS